MENIELKYSGVPVLHITNGIRCAAYSAARGSKNTSRAYALCGVFSHPHFGGTHCYRIALMCRQNVVYLERYMPFVLNINKYLYKNIDLLYNSDKRKIANERFI